ncbi:hypothetical protein MPSEU_001046500 [Mayamaea pseudoterrestris]|nr:hypothetical protein MPSEU_001046500 [Mayamaea pseudoterrestris]
MSSSQFTLRLVMDGRKQVVTMDPSSTVADLYEQAQTLIDEKRPKSKSNGTVELRTGFPSQLLEHSTSKTLQEAGIQSQQSVTVTIQRSATAAAAPPAKSPGRAAPKRAAAQKATTGFKEAIARQDEVENAKISAKTKKVSTSSSPNKKPRFTGAATTGYRLADGAVVSPRSRPRQASTSKKQPAAPHTGGDALESSVSFLTSATSGARTKQAQLMRTGWKQAVNDAYEQNKATARLAAITANKYEFALVHASGDSDQFWEEKTLQVTFDKGMQGRGEYSETVDYLEKAALSSALASIHTSHADALRPENMALLSPRVLWSLMYHYDCENGTPSVAAAMKQLQPDLDWSFLRRRKEQLSAKARENLRQKDAAAAAKSRAAGDTENDEWTRAAEAIASVELAMEEMQVVGQNKMLSTSAVRTGMVPWAVETPSELDVEELEACVAAHPPIYVAKDWVKLLQDKCEVHNWRELANESPSDISEALALDEEVCRVWVEFAQVQSVDEIIVEICDGSIEAASALREAANSGTPKDLAGWILTVPLLKEVLESYINDHAVEMEVPSIEQLQTWCERADQACVQLPWLESYITDESLQYDDLNR